MVESANKPPDSAGRNRVLRYLPPALVLTLLAVFFATGLHRYLTLETLVEYRPLVHGFVGSRSLTTVILFILVYALLVTLSDPCCRVHEHSGGVALRLGFRRRPRGSRGHCGCRKHLPDRAIVCRRAHPAHGGPENYKSSPRVFEPILSPICCSCACCPSCPSGSRTLRRLFSECNSRSSWRQRLPGRSRSATPSQSRAPQERLQPLRRTSNSWQIALQREGRIARCISSRTASLPPE